MKHAVKLHWFLDGTPIYARSKAEPKRRLFIGGNLAPAAVGSSWNLKQAKVLVPVTCRVQRFKLIEQAAYEKHQLDDWCY